MHRTAHIARNRRRRSQPSSTRRAKLRPFWSLGDARAKRGHCSLTMPHGGSSACREHRESTRERCARPAAVPLGAPWQNRWWAPAWTSRSLSPRCAAECELHTALSMRCAAGNVVGVHSGTAAALSGRRSCHRGPSRQRVAALTVSLSQVSHFLTVSGRESGYPFHSVLAAAKNFVCSTSNTRMPLDRASQLAWRPVCPAERTELGFHRNLLSPNA